MKVLNLYFSSTGITEKWRRPHNNNGREVGTQDRRIENRIDLLSYYFIFVGPGVYQWLPGKGLQEFIQKRLAHYARTGEIKYASPQRANKKVAVYCTYGGVHNRPRMKFMGQLFDQLRFEIVAEWYYIGEYPAREDS